MNSKECLEKLFASYYYDGNYQEVIEAREKLEKDLDRLEKLEKVIEILKDKLDIKLEFWYYGGCILNHKIIPNCIVSQERCLRHLEVEEYYLLKEVLGNE